MSAPRKPSYAQQAKTIAALSRENEIRDRLVQVKEQQISELRARIAELEAPQPAPKIALKEAAGRANIEPERLRRLCVDGKVDAEQEHKGSPWFVDWASVVNHMQRYGGPVRG
jgi:pyrrolidone-carboxylate peptidase